MLVKIDAKSKLLQLGVFGGGLFGIASCNNHSFLMLRAGCGSLALSWTQ